MLFAAREEELIVLGGLGCSSLLSVVTIVLVIFFLVSLMRALSACSPQNRTMEPGLVWLNLVPLLNLFWQFWTVIQVGNSLKREYHTRGLRSGGSFGKVLGVMMYLLGLFGPCVGGFGSGLAVAIDDEDVSPVVGFGSLGLAGVVGLIQLVLFIVYWSQIAGYTRELNTAGGYDRDDRPRRRRDEEYDPRDEFDDDYRPRRRPV